MVGVVSVLVFLQEFQDLGLATGVPLFAALNPGHAIEVDEGVWEGGDFGEGGCLWEG